MCITIVYRHRCMYNLKIVAETFENIPAWMREKMNMAAKWGILCEYRCKECKMFITCIKYEAYL